ALNDAESACAVEAERNFVKLMGGECSLPLGCYCEIKENSEIEISGFVASADGKDLIEDRVSGAVSDNVKLS
ncbi:MAG: hydroxymethylbilane synthase, partial [Candidatus Dadabacteria bacterium]|nr:hydroxymethylbilane synthase [Candidatus Dadabacteria bacterium]